MTTLLEMTERLPELDASEAIYAAEPWQRSSVAVVDREPSDGSPPAEARSLSCRFFLDVVVCRAAMIGFRAWLKPEPALEEKCLELVSFATETAERAASPIGGPTESLGSSGVLGGPPSVS